jgi:hypothetical protein
MQRISYLPQKRMSNVYLTRRKNAQTAHRMGALGDFWAHHIPHTHLRLFLCVNAEKGW